MLSRAAGPARLMACSSGAGTAERTAAAAARLAQQWGGDRNLDYIRKQIDRGTAKDAAQLLRPRQRTGGELPGRR